MLDVRWIRLCLGARESVDLSPDILRLGELVHDFAAQDAYSLLISWVLFWVVD